GINAVALSAIAMPEPTDAAKLTDPEAAPDSSRARQKRVGAVTVEIAPGELIDKITILEIKRERIADEAKLTHVRAELAALEAARDRQIAPSEELARLTAELRALNEALWQVEDDI